MKKQRHVLDKLSAYLDGEADDPQAVERHLQCCAVCAKRYMELSRLSAHVKALPTAEAHPAFAARVMARVREAAARKRLRSRRVVLSLTGAATVLALITIAAVYFSGMHSASDDASTQVAHGVWPQLNPDVLVEEIEQRLSEEDEQLLEESLVFALNGIYADEAEAELSEMLITEGLPTVFDESFQGTSELDVMFMNLDEVETEILRALLMEYAQGGQTT